MNDKYGIDLDVRADFISVVVSKKQIHSWRTTYAVLQAEKEDAPDAPELWRIEKDADFPDFELVESCHWRDAYQGASEMLKIAKRFVEWDAGRDE